MKHPPSQRRWALDQHRFDSFPRSASLRRFPSHNVYAARGLPGRVPTPNQGDPLNASGLQTRAPQAAAVAGRSLEEIADGPWSGTAAYKREAELLKKPAGRRVPDTRIGRHRLSARVPKGPGDQGADRLRRVPPPPVRGQHVIPDLHDAVDRRPRESTGSNEDARVSSTARPRRTARRSVRQRIPRRNPVPRAPSRQLRPGLQLFPEEGQGLPDVLGGPVRARLNLEQAEEARKIIHLGPHQGGRRRHQGEPRRSDGFRMSVLRPWIHRCFPTRYEVDSCPDHFLSRRPKRAAAFGRPWPKHELQDALQTCRYARQ